jgi:hypothetical protein
VKTEQGLQTQQNALNQARSRYQTSGTEKDNIVKYLPDYQILILQGFIGEEQRIHWMDDLRNVNLHYKFFGISYDISAQHEYKPAFPLDMGSFKLHRSIMKLNFAMLHELDLLVLLNALFEDKSPYFMMRDCNITRIPDGGRNKFSPNLNATCELDWITITEPNANGVPHP